MKRRSFLKSVSAVAALSLVPKISKAADEVYNGPLYIFVHAGGGWDPTMFCDPKETNKQVNMSKLRTSASGNNIKYPDLGVDYKLSNFFDKYGQDLLVINGINTQTNSHRTGSRYFATGKISDGNPALGALLGAIHLPSSPLAYLGSGGYTGTSGITPKVSINSSGSLNQIVNPNFNRMSGSNEVTFYPKDVYEKMKKMRLERMSNLSNNSKLESIKASIGQFSDAHVSAVNLKKIMEHIPDDINTHPKRSNDIFTKGRLAVAGYKAGLTAAVSLSVGGFDTHSNHDVNQLKSLERLFEGVDLLVEDARAQGIGQDIVVLMSSDFGRTAKYNSRNGKDHWTTTSYMAMGKGIIGNRVVGQSSEGHKYMKLNPQTLKADEEGVYITPAHIHKSLRKNMGIDANMMAAFSFPIDSSKEDMPIFI